MDLIFGGDDVNKYEGTFTGNQSETNTSHHD